ncbi:tetratricopeptide repeat protein [Pseudodesulfovibrio cashew]|uniref:Tetratricopeptide repeat protein n=1 Tax=Pseudodesulfovibrio cashew TaxID=2678688 RepID=A0A6I6JNJ5_9BACT|nr:tetratricopeptide repeat protein [Pseudodesulfovibrio cashew]QGY41717.1 tetratricopeptide repeat protein [Pseudodesulfovibrio cashew]
MTASIVTMGRKTVIIAVLFCVAAMFVTSFAYRMRNPNLFVQVKQPAGSTGQGAMTPPPGMTGGAEGPMAKVREYMIQVEKNPNDVKALINLGNSFLMMRAWDRALEPLEKANKLEPGNVHLLKAIGIARFNKKDYAEAAAAYEAVLKVEPEDTLALFNLGVIHKYYFEKQDQARTYFEKVLAVEKEDAELIKMAKQELEK